MKVRWKKLCKLLLIQNGGRLDATPTGPFTLPKFWFLSAIYLVSRLIRFPPPIDTGRSIVLAFNSSLLVCPCRVRLTNQADKTVQDRISFYTVYIKRLSRKFHYKICSDSFKLMYTFHFRKKLSAKHFLYRELK